MNLSINEQLMIDTKDANLCIFIANLAGWIRYNASKTDPEERNYHEGRYWSYNTIQDFVKYFGFWSTRNIRTIIKDCIELDLITTSTFNKKKYDNTLWYSLTDKGLEYYPKLRDIFLDTLVRSDKTLVRNDKPIPEDLNSLRNINITTSDGEVIPKKQTHEEFIVAIYHKILPDSPRIKIVDSKLSKQFIKMEKNWPKYSSSQEKFTYQAFMEFLRALKSKYPGFLKPYVTPQGNTRQNNLRTITSETNLAKLINGEFNFK